MSGLALASILTLVKVTELGEFALIERLKRACETRGVDAAGEVLGVSLSVRIGDDAAAWRSAAITEVGTTDTVVEGVHFTRTTTQWRDLGWKLMAANVSDIAAMGALPLYALVTLGLPPETQVEDIDALYEGMLACCAEYGVVITGGDIVRSGTFFATVALNGATELALLLRSTAKPGDIIGVTGPVGASGGGLEVLLKKARVDDVLARPLIQAHRHPRPQIAAGRALTKAGVRAAMDISDGLAADLAKLAGASGHAAILYAARLPMLDELVKAFPERHLDLALNGGEDYQLLFAAPPDVAERAVDTVPGAALIGEMEAGPPGQVTMVDAKGRTTLPKIEGWKHF